ncbi:thiol reductant ABC exporter subunit CydD [Yinghuangia sp. ASG 101]|uniref:thiol reductant ABC exporter subunit CydD n=1 Tax=Yinghuangia sp. ASG 101 TaxID=2896848 RepID=UPI001E3ABF1D|nr:thiol reductant ABC exporter subunit CydD [Yinghuangia sp. ASG 101]UGQ15178.1 thiol reductant ABC exporter subunit CydD [Yinghuangia sp. ASG 101]
MKPVDPRLLRHARATRGFLALTVVLGTVGAGLVIVQAGLLATLIVGAFEDGKGVADLRTPLIALAAVAAGRAAVAWLTEVAAYRTSAAVKSQLRRRLLAHVMRLGPAWLDGTRTGELTTLATRGIDALDGYFARYLPQLVLAVVVPVAVVARVVTGDWIAAVTIVVTLPLIPVFMALIGMATRKYMDRQWHVLERLAGHFLDVVAGLPTLKVFGRAKAQARSIRTITDEYRKATLKTLRVAFLSSFALELLATISVALVAVGIGLRLVDGDLDLYTALVVLILAPEAYLPLRQVGAEYHASAEGLAAAERVFAVLEEEAGEPARSSVPADAVITVDDLAVRHADRTEPSVSGVSLVLRPGETTALVGPSGVGKSTVFAALLAFVRPDAGRVTVGGVDLADLDPDAWRSHIAWMPQRPYLFAGSIADNLRMAAPEADDERLNAALRAAHADEFVAAAGGLGARLGEDGAGLSAGQRQRLALARAFLADRPVVLLDEPTANLDGASEAAVVDAVRRLAKGRTVLVATHRPALSAIADRVVRLEREPHAEIPGARVPVREDEESAPHSGPEPRRVPESEPPAEAIAKPTRELAAEPEPILESAPGKPRSAIRSHAGQTAVGSNDFPSGPPLRGSTGNTETTPARHPQTAPASGSSGKPPLTPPRPATPLRRLVSLARPVRSRLALAVLLGTIALGSSVGLMATSAWLISRASQHPPVLTLMVAVTSVRALGISRAVFRYAERLVSHDAAFRILADLRARVYEHLERLAPGGLPAFRRGDLLSRLVADVDAVQDFFLRALPPAAVAAVVGVAAAGATAAFLPEAGAVLAAGLLAAGVAVPWTAARFARRAERRVAAVRGELSAGIADLLRGAPELIAAGAAPSRLAAVDAVDTRLRRTEARQAHGAGLGSGLAALAAGATVWGCAFVGITAVAAGRLDGVLLALVVLTPLAAFEATAVLPAAGRHLDASGRAAARVFEVVDTPVPVREPARPEPLPAGPQRLHTRDLGARWTAAGPPALDGVDLDLTPGRRIAVVGPSGSGKTTLANVMLRFLDPSAGDVRLAAADDATAADLTRLAGDDVRRVIGLCAQDAHIFDSSIRENLRLARPGCDDADLRDALARARLLDWVDSLPRGLDTMVGEHGARMSGGQRQRLALARALLADFDILILDEPAEHLDPPTADALTADLLAATENRTTVLITHRLTGLDTVDEILVLDRGHVVQRGTWSELTAAPGPFRNLRARRAVLETP